MKRKQSRTCIAVAKNSRGKLMMAADRLSSYDWGHSELMNRPKIKKENGIIIGASGDGGLCTLIVDLLKIPFIESDSDTYVFYTLKNAIVKLLISHGYRDEHKLLRIPPDSNCLLLIIVQSTVYSMCISNTDPNSEWNHAGFGDISIDVCGVPTAIGCGDIPAIISLKKDLKLKGYNTKEHLYEALELACDISPGCGLIKNKKPDILVED